MNRSRRGLTIAAAISAVALALVGVGVLASPHAVTSRSGSTGSPGNAATTHGATATGGATPSPTFNTHPSVPVPRPTATSTPGPSLVPAPLDGLPTTPSAAAQHPIAVMVDDLRPARPQSGFSAASVVWQAPAEGGIPRYMMIFQERLPKSVGPIRSSRLYYIAWAAEWRAVYVHVGGSPQALETLAANGHGQLVYNADGYIYEGHELYRVTTRLPPHNEYSDASNLRTLARVVGAADGAIKPAWTFGPDADLADRPKGGTIDVSYPANHIHYAYDRLTNTYRRSVVGEPIERDAATGTPVAPKNIVTIVMHFGPLNDGHPEKKRLEANFVGSGRAWVSTNGITVPAIWRKASITAPTLLFDRTGHPITFTAGQTFVQVVQSASQLTFTAGTPVVVPPTHGPVLRVR
jgi:hypothetical protein